VANNVGIHVTVLCADFKKKIKFIDFSCLPVSVQVTFCPEEEVLFGNEEERQ
jgi:hypothetical protein